MQDIEPHFQWRDHYIAARDKRSPFYGREYSEFGYTDRIYNYLIHPQWDNFGSETLYLKVLFVDYQEGYAIIELIGEWNDAVHNDVMFLKREVIDPLIEYEVTDFILIMENVLYFHGDDTDYYEEWLDDIREAGGWVTFINIQDHVAADMRETGIDNYIHFGAVLNGLNWRPQKPETFYAAVEGLLSSQIKRLY
jgi:hypothetical protein